MFLNDSGMGKPAYIYPNSYLPALRNDIVLLVRERSPRVSMSRESEWHHWHGNHFVEVRDEDTPGWICIIIPQNSYDKNTEDIKQIVIKSSTYLSARNKEE